METVIECTRLQKETADKVLKNLQQQASVAVQLEKQNRIEATAANFGIATKDLDCLKSKLIPVIPHMWKELEVKPDDLELKMELSKRNRMMAAAETIYSAKDSIRRCNFTEDKFSNFGSNNYRAPLGRYAE